MSVCCNAAVISAGLAAGAWAEEPADISGMLDALRRAEGAPALGAALIRDGKIVGIGVCGVRSVETNEDALLTDRFPIGSCSKPMARFAIAHLAERGILLFSDTLGSLLKGMPMQEGYRGVTVAQIMAHQAGIAPYTEIGPRITPEVFKQEGSATQQRRGFAEFVLGKEPVAAPGTKFVYSNAGFCIAATAAEAVTGTAWEKLVADEVFAPLGMTTAVVGLDPDEAHRVIGHERTPNGAEAVRPFPRLAVMAPAGGVALSIEDFAKFAGAEAELEAGRAVGGISAETAQSVGTLRPADAGPTGAGGMLTFGGDGMYHAAFATWPEQHAAIVVATNLGESDDFCTKVAGAVREMLAADLSAGDTGGLAGGAGPAGPRFGFALMAVDDELKVGKVESGSIAEKSGLKEGDVLLKINGKDVGSISDEERTTMIRGQTLDLQVKREGETLEVHLKKP